MGSGWSQDEASVPQEPSADPNRVATQQDSRDNHTVEKMAAPTVTKLPLPHNFEAIVKYADSPLDRSNKDKIYTQLQAGVFLNNKRQKYWVDSKSNKNCFLVFARDLLITWAEDNRFWHWPHLKETSETSIDVAELINVCWLEVHGRFDTSKLSPKTLYEVKFVVKIKDPAYGWDCPVNMRLSLPDGSKQEHKENLMEKPREQWIEIKVGEFRTPEASSGEMEISMYEYEGGKWKKGLLLKGAIIQPKS